ncbi:MAG: sel1 repeat family protein [bacterium]|nr:sel1 repeat family protein [bacterium]
MRWYRRSWRDGNCSAANNIATIYRDEKNRRLAFQWWTRAQSRGDGNAAVDVGYCYQYGIGTRRNRSLARRMFKHAISADYVSEWRREEAMYHLAVVYLDAGSASRATQLLARASADGDFTEATSLLAEIRSQSPLTTCRCRRGIDKGLPGHAFCLQHPRSIRGPA